MCKKNERPIKFKFNGNEIAEETPLIVEYRKHNFRGIVHIDENKRHFVVDIDVIIPAYISAETVANVVHNIWNTRMVQRTYPWPTKKPISHLKWVQDEFENLAQNYFDDFSYDAFTQNA